MEVGRECLGAYVSQPHELEGVGERISNEYFPHTRRSELGNHQRVRAGSLPQTSHGTRAMNPPFQQMVKFFHHMAESMHDPMVVFLRK